MGPRTCSLAIAALVAAAPASAFAQACCSGSGALVPGRLNLHEDAAVGVQAKVTGLYGSFDPKGRFVAQSPGSREVDLEQDLIGAVRVLERGQIAVLVPMVESFRKVPGLAEVGGGLGDLALSARWDFTRTGASRRVPGIGLLAGLTLPTGTPADAAVKPLATDATGLGVFQGSLGLSLEHTFERLLVNVTGTAALSSARSTAVGRSQPGLAFTAFGAAGWSFDSGLVLALTASYLGQLATRIDGVPAAAGGRAQLRLGLAAGYAFNDAWRIQGSLFGDPPIPHAGQNETAGAGLAATLLRTF